MSKWNTPPEEVSAAWKPTRREAESLGEKLKSFSEKKVNGRTQYPFELHCAKENMISFDSFGSPQVINPLAYYRALETDALRQWIETKELEKLFHTFPEEKEAHEAKVLEWKMAVRDTLSLFKGDKSMKQTQTLLP